MRDASPAGDAVDENSFRVATKCQEMRSSHLIREARKFLTLISFVIKHFHINCRRVQNQFQARQYYLVNDAANRHFEISTE